MSIELKEHQKRAIHKHLDAIEKLHTNTVVDGPSAIDHEPYEKWHDADTDGECPVCSALMSVKAVRALLNGEST